LQPREIYRVAFLLSTQMRNESLAGWRDGAEGRLEAVVDFNLIAGDQFIGFVGHSDDGLQFVEHSVGHAFAACRGGMRSNAIVTVVSNADGDVEQFLGERIEGAAGSHDLFERFPGAFQSGGVVGNGFPEIVDPVGLAGGHNVVIDGANFRSCVVVFNECEGSHKISRKK
jgi:hypothetical protein